MTPGSLGELIAMNGQTEHYAWESRKEHTLEHTLIYTKDGGRFIAKLYGFEPLRLERTAALIGYLEDEVNTSE